MVRSSLNKTSLCEAKLQLTNLRESKLSGAKLIGTDLKAANLSGVSLIEADLSGANLSKANLNRASLIQADLRGASLWKARLIEADLRAANLWRATLIEADLRGACLSIADLRSVNLRGAKLIQVDLRGANLSGASLERANLTGTSLSGAKALRTNFEGAILTATCLEDWQINSETNLARTSCEYFYSRSDPSIRYPSAPERNLVSGELAKIFQNNKDTIDFIFKDKIDWQIFLSAFLQLKLEIGNRDLSIQGIENESEDTIVIRLKVPSQLLEKNIQQILHKKYQNLLQTKDSQRMVYDRSLESSREENIKIMKIIEIMAEKDKLENLNPRNMKLA